MPTQPPAQIGIPTLPPGPGRPAPQSAPAITIADPTARPTMSALAQGRARAADGRFVRLDDEPTPAQGDRPDALPGDRFLDREISWLQFNERVLQLAEDPELYLLERARFLAIFASNLDEFFMVRVAGFKRRIATGLAVRSASGLEPRELLDRIFSVATKQLMATHARVFQRAGPPGAGGRGHRARPLGRARATRSSAASRRLVPPTRSSRCSRRWPSTRRTRSRTSPGCRSTSPWCWSTRRAAPSTSPASRCRRCCPGWSGSSRGRRRRPVRRAVRAARGHHRRAPGPALPGHGGARALHLPGHPQRGPGGRGGRRREPARPPSRRS